MKRILFFDGLAWLVGRGDVDMGSVIIGHRFAKLLEWLGYKEEAAGLRNEADQLLDVLIEDRCIQLARSAQRVEERFLAKLFKQQ
jgi:hypothetical protein